MSDVEADTRSQHDDLDDTANQACYIFRPSFKPDSNERSAKRQKTKHVSISPAEEFPLLSHGHEPPSLARRRHELLDQEWERKKLHIDKVVSTLDEQSLGEIAAFVKSTDNNNNTATKTGKLSVGLVVSGPDTSIQTRLLDQWHAKQLSTSQEIVISQRSSSCSNLQVALKSVIKDVISSKVGEDGYHAFLAKHKRLIPMNFDLELLQLFVQEQDISKVVVSMLDIETFEIAVLSELLVSLASWSDRIPFVVLLGIATTVDLFGSRLPRSVISLLDATVFTLSTPDQLQHRLLSDLQTSPDTRVFLGPLTLSAFHELFQGHGGTIVDFSKTLEFAYMSHFFANPLAVLLDDEAVVAFADTKALCEAIRNTPSFQKHCEKLLSGGLPAVAALRDLINDDTKLLVAARDAIAQGQKAYRDALQIVTGLHDLRRKLGLDSRSPFLLDSQLYAHLDDLTTTSLFDETLAGLEKMTSVDLLGLVDSLAQSTIELFELSAQVDELQAFNTLHGSNAIHSTHSQPVQATAPKSITSTPTKKSSTPAKTTSATDSAKQDFTTILDSVVSQITSRVQSVHFDLRTTFLHEAFIFNSRQPLQSSFTPRPRFAIERALSKPGDYLGCECCSGNPHEEIRQSESEQKTAPPTSILYNLLQEAGTIINVRDLFDAFCSRLHPSSSGAVLLRTQRVNGLNQNQNKIREHDDPNGEEGNVEEDAEAEGEAEDNENENETDDTATKSRRRTSLALFYRSLSELKMLGLVKSSTSAMTKKKALASSSKGVVFGGGDNGGDGDSLGATTTGTAVGIRGRKAGYAEIDFIAKTSWEGL